MKTIINGMELEWTPKELKEFMDLCKELKKPKEVPVKEITRTIIAKPAWIGSRWWKNPDNNWNRKWQPVVTISVINWQRITYPSKTACAKFLNTDKYHIVKHLDTWKAINWYYVSSKLH